MFFHCSNLYFKKVVALAYIKIVLTISQARRKATHSAGFGTKP